MPQERPRPRPDVDLLYGRNAVREALRAGRRTFRRLLLAETSEGGDRLKELERLAQERKVTLERVDRARLDGLVYGHHQGVVLETGPYPYAEDYDLAAIAAGRGVVLALDGIVDPQNLGTLLRTAEAVGVALVVIPADRAASVTPAVVNASAGAVEHLQLAQEVNLARFLDRARDAGLWVVGMAGETGAEPLFDTTMAPPVVLVVGSEGAGLRRLVREKCDLLVALPMHGQVESLNAAVAGSIGLYEIVRDSEPESPA